MYETKPKANSGYFKENQKPYKIDYDNFAHLT